MQSLNANSDLAATERARCGTGDWSVSSLSPNIRTGYDLVQIRWGRVNQMNPVRILMNAAIRNGTITSKLPRRRTQSRYPGHRLPRIFRLDLPPAIRRILQAFDGESSKICGNIKSLARQEGSTVRGPLPYTTIESVRTTLE